MSLNAYQKICAVFFAILFIYWIVLRSLGFEEGIYNNLYVFLYGLIPLFGGIAAIKGYREWGGLSTILGKAILFLGFGLFCWGVGESIWTYYNIFLNVEIPYPSLADLFFAPSVFFYTLGTIYLSRTTGAGLGFKKKFGKIFAVTAPILVTVFTYWLIVVVGHGGEFFRDKTSLIKSILDVVYPLGDAVSLSVAVIVSGLSFKYLGGRYKWDILFILFGLAAMFAADSILSYTSNLETAYSGDFGDLVFTLAVFLLTFGLLGFNKLKEAAPAPAD